VSDEPDVEELQEELSQIKEAMGIADRYEGITSQWLLFGVLVALAAGISQYVMLEGLPGYWHAVVWIALLFGGGAVGMWWLRPGDGWQTLSPRSDRPGLFFVFGAAYLTIVPLEIVVVGFVGDLTEPTQTLLTLSLVLVMIGLAYLMMGNALRAYRIRNRDRYAFHVGGLLLIGLGTAIPFVEVLQTWAYAVFGGLYLVYALATYAVLTWT